MRLKKNDDGSVTIAPDEDNKLAIVAVAEYKGTTNVVEFYAGDIISGPDKLKVYMGFAKYIMGCVDYLHAHEWDT